NKHARKSDTQIAGLLLDVIHTVGPIGENPEALRSCYKRCLEVAKANGVRSIAFPSISTGVYGYPFENAAKVALDAVTAWIEDDDNGTKISRVVFCVFSDSDYATYKRLIPEYIHGASKGVKYGDGLDNLEVRLLMMQY
ncbi:hypothetical protein EV182_004987, partial [Spiromyces aspiralis]